MGKTTTLGIGVILSALGSAAAAYGHGTPIDFGSVVTALFSGFGLIFAFDAK